MLELKAIDEEAFLNDEPDRAYPPKVCRSAILDQMVMAAWGYVRLNADSLDSERACKMIRALVDKATEQLQGEVTRLEGLRKKHRETIRNLQKRVKELEAEAALPEVMRAN